MKKVFIALLLITSTICNAQSSPAWEFNNPDTSYRNYEDSEAKWLIAFAFNHFNFTTPATYPEGKPHYDAAITVFKIVPMRCGNSCPPDTIQISESFDGTFVPGGCFEDDPAYLIKTSKLHKLADGPQVRFQKWRSIVRFSPLSHTLQLTTTGTPASIELPNLTGLEAIGLFKTAPEIKYCELYITEGYGNTGCWLRNGDWEIEGEYKKVMTAMAREIIRLSKEVDGLNKRHD